MNRKLLTKNEINISYKRVRLKSGGFNYCIGENSIDNISIKTVKLFVQINFIEILYLKKCINLFQVDVLRFLSTISGALSLKGCRSKRFQVKR